MKQTGKLQSTMIGTNVKPQELIHFTNVLVKIIHLCLTDNFLPISKEMEIFNHL